MAGAPLAARVRQVRSDRCLAVARAALRQPPADRPPRRRGAREIRLLLDHREDPSARRTASIQRLRWHLHVEAGLEPQLRGLQAQSARRSLIGALPPADGPGLDLPRAARADLEISRRERELQVEISRLVRDYCPQALELPGCGSSPRRSWSARSPAPSASHPTRSLPAIRAARRCPRLGPSRRHRLSRRGSRELNCAFHRIAVTQARVDPEARSYLDRKRAEGHSTCAGLRCPSAISCVAPGSFFARVQREN